MNSEISDTLAAFGYAKVIATLAPAATLASNQGTVSLEVEKHFIVPDQTEALSLAAVAKSSASRAFRRPQALETRRLRTFPHLGLAIGYVDTAGAEALAADPAIARLNKAPEISLIRPVATRTVKPARKVSWGLERLNVERLWKAGFDGTGVLVGHLDTGVDASHPALKNAVQSFAEFDLAGDKVPNALPRDSGDHGTHTAGTIVGRASAKGAFGMAPGAKLASALVIEGGQVIDRILGGMDWIVQMRCPILSMSLGLRGFTPAFQQIVEALRAAGTLPIIAVGNEGPMTSRSPGNYETVLSVGAMDSSDKVADFSGSQKFNRQLVPLVPTVVAPGVGVLSCMPGGGFAEMDGSSMATPHVAGLAAVLLHAKPNATIVQLEQAIANSCRRPASMSENRANLGVPDAVRAFEHLTGGSLPVAISTPRKKAAGRPRAKLTKGRSKQSNSKKRSPRPPKRRKG